MPDNPTRPEATHRQRAAISGVDGNLANGSNGSPMAIVTGTASDHLPTVQFGNVLVGPVSITRWVEDDGDESVIEAARSVQKMAEAVCGSERRIIQWAIDPSQRVINPATGAEMAPTTPTQAPQSEPPAAPQATAPVVPPPPPATAAPAPAEPAATTSFTE
jgi:hypothetical protein